MMDEDEVENLIERSNLLDNFFQDDDDDDVNGGLDQ